MSWTDRQRRMLQVMGLRVWAPRPDRPVAGPDAAPAPAEPPSTATATAPVPVPRPAAVQPPIAVADAVASALKPLSAPGAAEGHEATVAAMDWATLRAAVDACQACALGASRQHAVFGVGHERAHWMIVGEAPGEQEDRQGEPFVGPAGQLLDAMLRALGLSRQPGETATAVSQVYIANTLKCRPPRNRNPLPEELSRCEPYLQRQIALVQPRIILAMGRFAIQQLLGSDEPVGRLRGRVHRYQGVPVVVTYHPAYLLRQPSEKAKAWSDLRLAADVYERSLNPSAR